MNGEIKQLTNVKINKRRDFRAFKYNKRRVHYRAQYSELNKNFILFN